MLTFTHDVAVDVLRRANVTRLDSKAGRAELLLFQAWPTPEALRDARPVPVPPGWYVPLILGQFEHLPYLKS